MARSNYDLPNRKIEEVKKLSNARSKREAIIIALDEYLRRKTRDELRASAGKFHLSWTKKSLKKHRRSA